MLPSLAKVVILLQQFLHALAQIQGDKDQGQEDRDQHADINKTSITKIDQVRNVLLNTLKDLGKDKSMVMMSENLTRGIPDRQGDHQRDHLVASKRCTVEEEPSLNIITLKRLRVMPKTVTENMNLINTRDTDLRNTYSKKEEAEVPGDIRHTPLRSLLMTHTL